ncbi:MAG: NAD(P)H-dependent oxidoreductase [Candidatus Aenigmarchaeota archaeon]|nr:NAD(P)H-dependent oxidoreductase [Candidatus Aenigmarchaeota archaeon]
MDFEKIMRERYATKLFDKRKIPEEKIQKLIEIIRLTPSSYNLQPWKIKIISDDETKNKLMPASFNQKQIETCSHLLVLCADTDILTRLEKITKTMKENGIEDSKIKSYSSMVKEVVKSMKNEEILNWTQKQVYILLANTLNAAKHLGLDSCPMEGFEPKEYSKILNLPKNLVPTVLCPIGYAADTPRKKIRLEKEDIIF